MLGICFIHRMLEKTQPQPLILSTTLGGDARLSRHISIGVENLVFGCSQSQWRIILERWDTGVRFEGPQRVRSMLDVLKILTGDG